MTKERQGEPAEGLAELTAVGSAAEAAMLMGDLQAAGISSMQRPGAISSGRSPPGRSTSMSRIWSVRGKS